MPKAYYNPHHKSSSRGLINFILWQTGYYNDIHPLRPIPAQFTYPNKEENYCTELPHAMWVNHSTFLVGAYGKNILVDPIWSQRCSPVSWVGPKRYVAPGISLCALPTIDYVIISHNHYDHLDKNTVLYLVRKQKKIIWIIPKGVKTWFTKLVPEARTEELDWWQSIAFLDPSTQEEIKFTSVPAQHFSGRTLFDRNKSLWMGCVVEFINNNAIFKRFYFAGDTGYNPFDFKKIGKVFEKMDLSLIPIGAYHPRKFMRPVHVHPDESAMIHKEVQSKLSIGGHFGTFRLSNETLPHPPYDLYLSLKEARIPHEEFRVLRPGQIINW